jgi:hypothetical protein
MFTAGSYVGPRLFDTLLQGHLDAARGWGEAPVQCKARGSQKRHMLRSCCKRGVESIELVAISDLQIVNLLPTKPTTAAGCRGLELSLSKHCVSESLPAVTMARYALHCTHNRCAQGSEPMWVFAVGLLLNVEPPHIKSGYGERNRYSQKDPPVRC